MLVIILVHSAIHLWGKKSTIKKFVAPEQGCKKYTERVLNLLLEYIMLVVVLTCLYPRLICLAAMFVGKKGKQSSNKLFLLFYFDQATFDPMIPNVMPRTPRQSSDNELINEYR